jgi:hypothetical protein
MKIEKAEQQRNQDQWQDDAESQNFCPNGKTIHRHDSPAQEKSRFSIL